MRNVKELSGIIKGINYDQIINNKEIEYVKRWVDENRNFVFSSEQEQLIELLDKALADNILTEKERRSVLDSCSRILEDSTDYLSELYELNGIVEGIICDSVLNEEEILHLKEWLDLHSDYVKEDGNSQEILIKINEILSDGIITQEEKASLLELLEDNIRFLRFKANKNRIINLVNKKKNIGIELIELLNDKESIKLVHNSAILKLRKTLNSSYAGNISAGGEIVIISLCLIGLLEYNGNYYDQVRRTYSSLYDEFSEGKSEGVIRSVIVRHMPEHEGVDYGRRKINRVLTNAIVPLPYLCSFFDFIYDIYERNFECELPDNLYEEFLFVYEGLRRSLDEKDDDFRLNVTKKTYKLIKTTKILINNGIDLDAIIKLSIYIVRLIDEKVWKGELEKDIANPYLANGYKSWSKLYAEQADHTRSKREKPIGSRWEPRIELDGDSIYLCPPIHRFKGDFDYSSVRVVVQNNGHTLYENNSPYIKEIIGGYQVNIDRIKLNLPLGNIVYRFYAGETVLYDSETKLCREYIVFNQDGSEIKNHTECSGNIIICANKGAFSDGLYYEGDYYCLYSKIIKEEDFILIGDDVFCFSALIKPGIMGEKYENQFLVTERPDIVIDVYSNVEYFIFESKDDSIKYEISINGHPYSLNELKYERIISGGSVKYKVYLDIIKSGVYDLVLYAVDNGSRSLVKEICFGLDTEFEYEEIEINEESYHLLVDSGFIDHIEEQTVNINSYNDKWFSFIYKGVKYYYILPIRFSLYKINKGDWNPMGKEIWINDLNADSIISFCGIYFDQISVCSRSGELLHESIKIFEKQSIKFIRAGFLLSFKNATDYTVLWFMKDGKCVNALYCYNHCVIDKDNTFIEFNPVDRNLVVRPCFFGKGNVAVEIQERNGAVLYSRERVTSGESVVTSGYESFKPYVITISEISGGLLIKQKRELLRVNRKLYCLDDFNKKYFKIKSITYYRYLQDHFKHYSNDFRDNVYLYIKNKQAESTFTGLILIKDRYNRVFKLKCVNPVEIAVCSDLMNEELVLAITNEGDGLLFDTETHRIMDALVHKTAPDIISYTIDVNGADRI